MVSLPQVFLPKPVLISLLPHTDHLLKNKINFQNLASQDLSHKQHMTEKECEWNIIKCHIQVNFSTVFWAYTKFCALAPSYTIAWEQPTHL